MQDYIGIDDLSKALGCIIAERGAFHYTDKIAYAPSKEVLIFYIREALRDFMSLKEKGSYENEKVRKIVNDINIEKINKLFDKINEINDRKELIEIANKIASKAICEAMALTKDESKEGEE